MKRSSLLAFAAIALAVAAPAFADGGIGPAGGYGDASGHSHGARTRAEVRAELEQAQRDGTLAALRKSMSYAPPGAELGAPRPYRPDPDTNQLAGAGRKRDAPRTGADARRVVLPAAAPFVSVRSRS